MDVSVGDFHKIGLPDVGRQRASPFAFASPPRYRTSQRVYDQSTKSAKRPSRLCPTYPKEPSILIFCTLRGMRDLRYPRNGDACYA